MLTIWLLSLKQKTNFSEDFSAYLYYLYLLLNSFFTSAVAKPYYYNSYYEPNLYLDASDDCLLWLKYSDTHIVNKI